MFCANCGKEAPETAKFCYACGSKMGAAPENAVRESEPVQGSRDAGGSSGKVAGIIETMGGTGKAIGLIIMVLSGISIFFGVFEIIEDGGGDFDGLFWIIVGIVGLPIGRHIRKKAK